MKKMEQVTQSRKRRPLEEAQDNITVEQTLPTKLSAGADCATGNENGIMLATIKAACFFLILIVDC